MASITKRGNSYLITVSDGTALSGDRIRQYMTWTPPRGMTERQAEKEVNRQAVLFEDKVLAGLRVDNNMRFADFIDFWMEQHCKMKLKAKTVAEYEKLKPVIFEALGHIKLRELRPTHLNAFYNNLLEDGMRCDTKYVQQIDLAAKMAELNLSKAELSRRCGLSIYSIRSAVTSVPVTENTAELLCAELALDMDEAFIPIEEDAKLSKNTVHHYHSMISSCLGKAVKWEYLPNNPASRADPPQPERKEASYLEVKDAKIILEHLQDAPVHFRDAIIFDLITGLRRGELLGLSWPKVDFDNQLIRISQALYYLSGKGLYLDDPKNESSGRVLRLPRSAFSLLNYHRTWQNEQAEKLGVAWHNEKNLVFTGPEGKPIHPDTLTGWFTDFCETLGYENIHLHSLRHTYASLMIAEGTPLVIVSKRMGHAQVSTTSNIYSHMISSADEKAAQVTDVFEDAMPKKISRRSRKNA